MRKTLAICLLCVDWQKHKNLFCKAVTRSSNIVAPKKSFVIHNPSRGVFVCKNVAKLRVAWHLFSTAQMINCDQNTTLLSIFEWEAGKTYYNLPGSWSAAGQGRSNRRRGGGGGEHVPPRFWQKENQIFFLQCVFYVFAPHFFKFSYGTAGGKGRGNQGTIFCP
jgi:hypothetical protein